MQSRLEFGAPHVAALEQESVAATVCAKRHGRALHSLYSCRQKLKKAAQTSGSPEPSSAFVIESGASVCLNERSMTRNLTTWLGDIYPIRCTGDDRVYIGELSDVFSPLRQYLGAEARPARELAPTNGLFARGRAAVCAPAPASRILEKGVVLEIDRLEREAYGLSKYPDW